MVLSVIDQHPVVVESVPRDVSRRNIFQAWPAERSNGLPFTIGDLDGYRGRRVEPEEKPRAVLDAVAVGRNILLREPEVAVLHPEGSCRAIIVFVLLPNAVVRVRDYRDLVHALLAGRIIGDGDGCLRRDGNEGDLPGAELGSPLERLHDDIPGVLLARVLDSGR